MQIYLASTWPKQKKKKKSWKYWDLSADRFLLNLIILVSMTTFELACSSIKI